ncbi:MULTISPECIES: hypothetical protein [unclassified Streptomyces]|uniref:hypothetical protein n=1 Tax=unclassified Streptomyces TaxID=2593676 RepID=UPI002E17B091|nr:MULTISPECIES: hypothetical protein [unclassified Streptomyces]
MSAPVMSPQPQAPVPPQQEAPADRPKKKRRVFLWFFLAVQALFLVWMIAGANSGGSGDCGTLDAQTCKDAGDVGTAIGLGLVLALWAVVDIILGISYGIYRLCKR